MKKFKEFFKGVTNPSSVEDYVNRAILDSADATFHGTMKEREDMFQRAMEYVRHSPRFRNILARGPGLFTAQLTDDPENILVVHDDHHAGNIVFWIDSRVA